MDDTAILEMLKANLEKVNSVNDSYLNSLIGVAKAEIAREGIVLEETDDGYTIDDANLIVMYAAYLYRKRADTTEGHGTAALNPQGMPYMLRYALNIRQFKRAKT